MSEGKWNQERVCRIYNNVGTNLRIKPRKRLVRDKLGALTVLESHQPSVVDGLHAQPARRRRDVSVVQRHR